MNGPSQDSFVKGDSASSGRPFLACPFPATGGFGLGQVHSHVWSDLRAMAGLRQVFPAALQEEAWLAPFPGDGQFGRRALGGVGMPAADDVGGIGLADTVPDLFARVGIDAPVHGPIGDPEGRAGIPGLTDESVPQLLVMVETEADGCGFHGRESIPG